MEVTYEVHINTDSYAGNFERELCAYLTGQIGECGVGDKYSHITKEGRPDFEDRIKQVADDHGCWRPVEGRGNTVVIYFEEAPTPADIAHFEKNIGNFNKDTKILKSYITTNINFLSVGVRKVTTKVEYEDIQVIDLT